MCMCVCMCVHTAHVDRTRLKMIQKLHMVYIMLCVKHDHYMIFTLCILLMLLSFFAYINHSWK